MNFYRFLGLFLVSFAVGAADTPWCQRLSVSNRSALAEINLRPEGTVRLRLRHPQDDRELEFTVSSDLTKVKAVPSASFPPEQLEQVATFSGPSVSNGLTRFTFKRTETQWRGYINDTLVFRCPELWATAVCIEHPEELLPLQREKEEYVQRLGSFLFEDNFLVPEGSAFPPTWEILQGSWKLHSVTGSVSGSSMGYQLAKQPLPHKSPNFYTLEGTGTNAIVLAGESFYSHYLFKASVQHNSGTNGLIVLADERGGFFAFTARTHPDTDRLILELWRQPAVAQAERIPLAAVQTELPAGQWLLLEVQLFEDGLICRADNIEVIRHRSELPPCGRFGFFCNMPEGESTRFDDVTALSHQSALLDSTHDLLQATERRTSGLRAFPYANQAWLYFPATQQTNQWIFRADTTTLLSQETFFVASGETFTCGLTLGDETETNRPGYRFSCIQEKGKRTYRLDQFTSTRTVTLDTFVMASTSNRVTLGLDPLRPNELRCTADGRIVCFYRPAQQPLGKPGLFSRGPCELFCSPPSIVSQVPLFTDRFEKNPLYVNDPYMRHWASPEGQWIDYGNGMTWFKGDLIGPVKLRLPIVDGMELHLCIPEGASNSLLRVETKADQIHVYTPESKTTPAISLPTHLIPTTTSEKKSYHLFTVGIMDHVLWIGTDDLLLRQIHLPQLQKGRRMRIKGLTVEQLAQTLVKREKVFDTLFTESLFNWTINGGRWEVINRFYCEPTWSHMNGESRDSLAALWSKYIFSGDFSVEFYAGMRMGWYTRAGDLNLTVMSADPSTGSGYTAIATGWDPDHSQLYSKLLRNGEPKAITDKYLVPRIREGNIRQGYQPLIAKGRDIHGAWYGMQFRRVGTHLQYLYDNELIFEVDDPQPLQNGSLGIWTYQNSMMIARIRIAAESIRPRPFRYHALPLTPQPSPIPVKPIDDSGIRINDRVAQPLVPEYWESYDTVSHPNLRFRNLDSSNPELHVTSLLGAGTFLTRCNLPPAHPDKLLGWRFEVARHPKARLNFEFCTVATDAKGQQIPVQGWTYVLNGTDEERGPRKIIGQLHAFPASDPAGTNLVWTPVEVWVPSEIIRANQAVLIEGFGNLQPSEVQEGLVGNPPHAWYAIRAFREIHRGIPVVTAPHAKRNELSTFAHAINSLRPGELHVVEIPAALDTRRPLLEWAVPDLASFGLRTTADARVPGSILISPTHPWPSPILPPSAIQTNGKRASFISEGNSIRVFVPYDVQNETDVITLNLELPDNRVFQQTVSLRQDGMTNHPPTLVDLQMPDGGVNTFEERPGNPAVHTVLAPPSIQYLESERGGVLKFDNHGIYGNRLSGLLIRGFDPMVTPLFQFRYKADPMAIVSLDYGAISGFSFTEKYRGFARSLTAVAPADNAWHTFTCLPTDNTEPVPLTRQISFPPAPLKIASQSATDQTGLHSTLFFDDITCGPAVGPKRPLAFKADYFDADGVAEVAYAFIKGLPAFDNRSHEEQQKVTRWISAPNHEVVRPDIASLEETIYHLLIRAKDTCGLQSPITDVPFVVLRHPPTIHARIEKTEQFNGSRLMLELSSPVVLPNINALRISHAGTSLSLKTDPGTMQAREHDVLYEIDWIWQLRKQLASAKHGDLLPITIDGVTDAAGNPAPPFRFDIPIQLKNDVRPPTVPPYVLPTNTLIFFPTVNASTPLFADLRKHVAVTTSPGVEESAAVFTLTENSSGFLVHNFGRPWDPDRYPWLSISFKAGESATTDFIKAAFSLTFSTGAHRQRWVKNAFTLQPFVASNACYVAFSKPYKKGEWCDLLVNVQAFMQARSEDKHTASDVTYLALTLHGKTRGMQLQIRSFAILAPWNSETLLALRPYDLNGIKGLLWDTGSTRLTGLRPANLARTANTPYWFRFRISDRCGNRTPIWTLPIPPDSQKTDPTLPDFFAVDD